MTDTLRTWILGIGGAAILTSICMTITPDGKVKKVVGLCCGIMVMLMMITPVIGLDFGAFSADYARLRSDAGMTTSDFEEKLSRLIIEEACSAYILDKGTQLGIHDLAAQVSVRWNIHDEHWYPYAAVLITEADVETRDELARMISDLGIPPEELIWRYEP